ncbi:MAG: DUF4276 family protein [Planctomycetes bacterium]|nr:DUF4276 family protein [Planctomycetota bacterium]
MSNIRVLVEGHTEILFVNEVLKPYLCQKGDSIRPFLLQEAGGIPKYSRSQKQILNTIKSERSSFCTTMVDFYEMPNDWPGRTESRSCRNYQDKAQRIEQALSEDIAAQMGDSWNPAQFIPYVQMHEFEALLFSDTLILAESARKSKVSAQLECVLQSFSCPEEINGNYHTCPSRRIKQHIENYEKTVDGIIAARKIGLRKMRQECPHFNEWITKLEDIGNQ